jgi:hypothetical protein
MNIHSVYAMEKKVEKKRRGITFREIIGGDFLTSQSMVRQMPFFFFVVVLFFIQISMIYYFESVQIEMKHTKEKLNDLNSEYSTNASELSVKSQQSEVVGQVQPWGLINSTTIPFIIDVDSNFFKTNHE